MALEQADILRLDHFRGFAEYWEVEAGAESAINGHWAPGPGADLFEVASQVLGPLPLIAEDLGLITPDVHELRAKLGYPGMKVLVEAFHGGADNIYLPHNYTHDFVVYPGTHDMQTVRGWWANLAPRTQEHARQYMRVDGHDIAWDLIHQAFASVADLAIIQMQDLLDLDNAARMNTPGTSEGNWTWRYQPEQITQHLTERLRLLTRLYGRDRPVAEKKAAEQATKSEQAATPGA
jgi:4-alpha-glucanotransferase